MRYGIQDPLTLVICGLISGLQGFIWGSLYWIAEHDSRTAWLIGICVAVALFTFIWKISNREDKI